MFKDEIRNIFEKQYELDHRIINDNPYPSEKMKIALFVELGELMNELPTKFKHWKKLAVDNREKALEEYVDCLHFLVSLIIRNEKQNVEIYSLQTKNYDYCLPRSNQTIHKILVNLTGSYILPSDLTLLFELGHLLNFEWTEIYQCYLSKNDKNHERQDKGY